MPIYMDRHDLPEDITAEHVAKIHQADLKIEHKFGCKGLTYWFDETRKTAFCLIKAPNKEAIQTMHNEAHGGIPNSVIEVDDNIVESFLGRIEDPKKSQKTELNIINDPAFRTIMVGRIKRSSFKHSVSKQVDLAIYNHSKSLVKTINKFNGSIVKQNLEYFLTSFDSITNAVLCAIEIQTKLKQKNINTYESDVKFNIGLSAGIPVTDKEVIFEDTIKTAERLCGVVNGQIAVSSKVKDLYESENLNISIDEKFVYVLNPTDEKFLNMLMDYIEKEWTNTALNIDEFSKELGYSKSQLYRKLVSLTGKSPNIFIKEYRLNKALKLLDKQIGNISKIAYDTGFNSPAYFSKCFQKTFGVLPSNYIKQRITLG